MSISKEKIKAISQKITRASKNVAHTHAAGSYPNDTQSITPLQVVKELSTDYAISAKDMAGVLDVTPKTFSRWKRNSNVMSEQQADRMFILKSIFDLGRKVLGSDANVKKWIREPIFSLNGQIPLKLLKIESGRRRIESVLHQIEYGFF